MLTTGITKQQIRIEKKPINKRKNKGGVSNEEKKFVIRDRIGIY